MAFDIFGLGSLIGGIAQAGTNAAINSNNLKHQKEVFNWQKQQTAWQNQFAKDQFEYQKQQNLLTQQREDNAMQRRYADLQKAGINPLSAVGTGGASSAVTAGSTMSGGSGNATAPQMETIQGIDNIVTGVMNVLTQRQNISQSRTQEKLLEEQARTEREKQSNIGAGTKEIKRKTQYYDDLSSKAEAEIQAIKKENELRELRKETEKAKAKDTWNSAYNKEWDLTQSKSSATKTHEKSYYGILDGSGIVQGGGILGNVLNDLLRNLIK